MVLGSAADSPEPLGVSHHVRLLESPGMVPAGEVASLLPSPWGFAWGGGGFEEKDLLGLILL